MIAVRQPISFSLDNTLSELNRLSEMLEMIGEQWELPGKVVLQINLALDELFTNVVSYGLEKNSKQQITFTLYCHADKIKIIISDQGKPFDPTLPPDPDLEAPLEEQQIGGLGIFLIRQCSDKIAYKRENGKNIVTLTKKI